MGLAGIDLFHGQIGIAGNERDGRLGECFAWLDFEAPDAIYDARGIFESFEERMMRCGFMLEAKIGIHHRTLAAASPVDGEEIGEAEVFAAHAPLVVEAGFIRRDEITAIFDEGAKLIAL